MDSKLKSVFLELVGKHKDILGLSDETVNAIMKDCAGSEDVKTEAGDEEKTEPVDNKEEEGTENEDGSVTIVIKKEELGDINPQDGNAMHAIINSLHKKR